MLSIFSFSILSAMCSCPKNVSRGNATLVIFLQKNPSLCSLGKRGLKDIPQFKRIYSLWVKKQTIFSYQAPGFLIGPGPRARAVVNKVVKIHS